MMQNSKKASRSWLYGTLFVWVLTGVVAITAYSSRSNPPAQLVSLDDKTAVQSPVDELAKQEVSASTAPKTGAPKEIVWEETFEGAMQRARLEKKPIMIDFYTDWCGACKQFEKDVLPQKAVISEAANWVTIRINGEKRPDVAGAYGVTGYPTFIFAQSTGKPVAVLPGYAPNMDFAGLMRDARGKAMKAVS